MKFELNAGLLALHSNFVNQVLPKKHIVKNSQLRDKCVRIQIIVFFLFFYCNPKINPLDNPKDKVFHLLTAQKPLLFLTRFSKHSNLNLAPKSSVTQSCNQLNNRSVSPLFKTSHLRKIKVQIQCSTVCNEIRINLTSQPFFKDELFQQ